MQKVSKSLKDTRKIAKDFLSKTLKIKGKRAQVVSLSGELGAGKTAFAQALARELGVKRKVTSPTFVIIKKYSIKNQKNPKFNFLFHLDAYRLKNHQELLRLGWEEIIGDPEHLVLIEWPENVKKAMPRGAHSISIISNKNSHRRFTINYA